ncbi:NAD(P)-binding protein [Mytilinidion resinicola]|uniref:NAD(P)-binding protein n=1 Tax=Mytilinidion resinicola TaxID=574789 RepID=A0A6A6YKV7_9PEZI|nr:NAD(P)-binding protein [Mytilinidion resinicola]KAF2809430.1 NAD(P)-binding protein [Mytilinidion resinicola]
MWRPQIARTPSTNVGAGSAERMLEGKVGIVTGAPRGIGIAICHNLASKGCSLVLNYISDSSAAPADELASQLQREYGVKAVPVQADLGSEKGPEYLISMAKSSFQHPKTQKFQLDIIINNAGVAHNNKIDEVNAEDFAWQYNINVRGPLFLMKAALPYLPHDRSGRIVNLSSVSASCGFIAQSVYGGTKAALEAMTRTWARELAERAIVNAVNPGPVGTDMYWNNKPEFFDQIRPFLQNTPLAAPRDGIDSKELVEASKKAGGRPAYEEEIAGVVAMLCSPDAAWSTGNVVCANGGFRFSV